MPRHTTRAAQIRSGLRREDPIALWLQTHNVAGLEVAVARRIDFNHCLVAIGAQSDIRALRWTERTDAFDRSLQRAAAGGPDNHIMPPDE